MMLGNLSICQMEERLGIEFPEPFRTDFAEMHQSKADDIKPGKWHCFDLPLYLICGDRDTAKMVQEALTPLQEQMTGSLTVGLAG